MGRITPPAITAHALQRYREIVRPGVGLFDAVEDLICALQFPVFVLPIKTGRLMGLRAGRTRFLALERDNEIHTVGPFWYWHEARPAWRAHGFNSKTGRACQTPRLAGTAHSETVKEDDL